MVTFRGNQLEIIVSQNDVIIKSHAESDSTLFVYDKEITVKAKAEVVIPIEQPEMVEA